MYTEAQGLVEVDSSTILDPVSSNHVMSWGYAVLSNVVPAPSLLFHLCSSPGHSVAVSATGIKATCIPLAHVAAHTLPSSSGLFPCSLCFTYGGLSTHSFYFLFYFTLQYCIGIAVH